MKVPEHIAIIMDGNRRWAESKNLPVFEGHRAGAEQVRKIMDCCAIYGIKYLTLFAFSTENWQRPPEEVNALMGLLNIFIDRYIDQMNAENIRLHHLGRIEKLPEQQRKILKKAVEKTKHNTKYHLILAINYGSRAEIADAAKQFASKVIKKEMKISDLNEENFRNLLYLPDIPDPDLLIRTSGEQRLSNFLLWQLSYSELYFSDVFWPDFGEEEFKKAIEFYSKRERRFGKR